MVRTLVLQQGRVSRTALDDAPFTYFGPHPADRLFQPAEVEEIMQFANQLV
jgi:hypothetical protein